jgi:hypothetical protein
MHETTDVARIAAQREMLCDDGDDGDDTCPSCHGNGGWASCVEDCCPYVGGEEDCDDPVCWRRCDLCRGKGWLSPKEEETSLGRR